jgi:hypothetical protein
MNLSFFYSLADFFLIGYLIGAVLLNITMYMIASFYSKKFNEPTQKSGFIVCIFLCLVYILILLFVKNNYSANIILGSILILSSFSSIASSVSLYLKMRKTRK